MDSDSLAALDALRVEQERIQAERARFEQNIIERMKAGAPVEPGPLRCEIQKLPNGEERLIVQREPISGLKQ